MDMDVLLDYCLAKPGAYLDYPFGPGVAVAKVRAPTQPSGRVFAQVFTLRGVPTATLSCDPLTATEYRALYPGVVVRGYHCPPVQQPYFNSLPLAGRVPQDEILELADIAYEVVVAKLPKYRQRELATSSGAPGRSGPGQ
ncbi:MAG: MmcQ/YjbR family DNA-binding protein [Propionibacteriaceae bacterium]|nr:MmcQ/YjbR family DNA-binding protein [Propionibacteriaceae bacterium]